MLSFIIAIINLLLSSEAKEQGERKRGKVPSRKVKKYIGLIFAVIAFILFLVILFTHYPPMPEPSIKTLSSKCLKKENNAYVYQFEIHYAYYGGKPVSLIFATQPKGQPYVALQMKDCPPTNIRSIPIRGKTGTIASGPVYIGNLITNPEQIEHYFYPILVESNIVKNLYDNIPRPNKICAIDNLHDIFNFVTEKSFVVLPRVGYPVDFKKNCP